ncbi:hypothetical protein IFR05_009305 [Cadophora sp. M221]|nr:hypothetical protein IFR05_009305 [Cadophora sp. M221]
MEIVITRCVKCNSELGRFRNSWNGIGNSYQSPVYPPVSVIGLEATGDIYNGAKNSHIERSLLQDIACVSCRLVVGLRCETAPDGHLLKENQLILRLTDMSVVTEEDGDKAKISILKCFPLSIAASKKPAGTGRAATIQPSPRIQHSGLGTPVHLHKSVVSRTPCPDDRLSLLPPSVTVSEVTKFKTWAEDAINSQQKDIDRISRTINGIKQDMRLFKNFMIEVRSELASSRHQQLPDPIGEEDLSALREDLDGLRQQVKENGQAISKVSGELPSRSLQDIAQDVEKVSQKVSKVDGLKSELERMRARVKSLEDSRLSNVSAPAVSSRQLRLISGPNKRRQNQTDNLRSPSQDSPTEPLQKRRRAALSSPNEDNSSTAGHIDKNPDRQLAPARDPIEILSSEHDTSSPIRGQDDEQDHPTTPNNTQKKMPAIPNSTSSASALGHSSGNIRGPASTEVGYSSVQRTGSSRIEVRVPYSCALAMSMQQQVARIRNSNGDLLLPKGKVERRSSRFKGRKSGKVNAGPDNDDSDSQEPGFEKADGESTHVTRSMGSRKIVSSPAPASARQDSVSPAEGSEDAKKIFKCGGCGKGYRTANGLDYHHNHPEDACNKADNDVVPRTFQCEKCQKAYSVYQSLEYVRTILTALPSTQTY